MYRFDWTELITSAVVARLGAIAAEAGADAGVDVTLLAAVFSHIGGLPFATSEWSEEHRSAVAEKLLSEATGALLAHRYGIRAASHTVYPLSASEPIEARLVPRLDPNRASLRALADLPVIGPALATKIVEDRRRRGRFASLAHLEARISGFGGASSARIRHVLRFVGDCRQLESKDLDERILAAFAMVGCRSVDELLEELAVFVASDPHPATRLAVKRDELEPVVGQRVSESARGSVKILADRSYETRVGEVLAGARSTIDICMFFMALGGEAHGTRALLDTLVDRAQRGCQVRVLLDRDDDHDVYGSRIINTNAARYLAQRGVAVHVDEPTRLTHSKFVLVDDDQLIVGSHNWTTGSYRHYRDLSFEVRGEAAGLFRDRFESLWGPSTPHPG